MAGRHLGQVLWQRLSPLTGANVDRRLDRSFHFSVSDGVTKIVRNRGPAVGVVDDQDTLDIASRTSAASPAKHQVDLDLPVANAHDSMLRRLGEVDLADFLQAAVVVPTGVPR